MNDPTDDEARCCRFLRNIAYKIRVTIAQAQAQSVDPHRDARAECSAYALETAAEAIEQGQHFSS